MALAPDREELGMKARRVVLDGLRVTVEFADREPAVRVWDTAAEAERDAFVSAATFGTYVFDTTPVRPLVVAFDAIASGAHPDLEGAR